MFQRAPPSLIRNRVGNTERRGFPSGKTAKAEATHQTCQNLLARLFCRCETDPTRNQLLAQNYGVSDYCIEDLLGERRGRSDFASLPGGHELRSRQWPFRSANLGLALGSVAIANHPEYKPQLSFAENLDHAD